MTAYPSALEPDSIFAKDFKVVRGLRLGGMGAVYIVTQLSTGKQRALKLLASQLVNNAEMRERFVREARAAAQIESDHVVEIVTAGVDDDTGTPFIAMELLRGEELADAVDRRGAFSLGEVREVLAQIGHALEQAHAQRIVHRDLKPENIFLARPKRRGATFTAKLLDFGVAKFLALGASELGTTPVGSPLFMAPEQTDSFGNICPGTDVWALGLLAFYLLTGRSYWLGAEKASVPVLLREVCLDPLVRASARARELGVGDLIPEGFDDWFDRCVVREVDDRYAEAGEAVRAFLAAVPDAAPPSRFPEPLSQPPSADFEDVYGAASEEDGKPALELSNDVDSAPPPADPPGGLWFEPTPDLPSDAEPASGGSMWLDPPAESAAEPATAGDGGFWSLAEPVSAPETEPSATDGAPPPSDASPPQSLWFSEASAEPAGDGASGGGSSLWGESPAEAAGDGASPPSAAASLWGESPAEIAPEPPVAEPAPAGDRLTPAGIAQEVASPPPAAPRWRRVVSDRRARFVAVGVVAGALVGGLVGLRTRAPKISLPQHASSAEVAPPPIPAEPAPPSPCPPGSVLVSASSIDAFCLDRTEVSVRAYERCVAAAVCDELGDEVDYPPTSPKLARAYRQLCNADPKRALYPVNCIDWWGASTYCHFRGGRLPSEAELEAASRMLPEAPKDEKKPTANRCGDECLDWGLHFGIFVDTDSKEWDGWMGTSPVGWFAHGTKAPFADLDGNVAEWTVTRAGGVADDHDAPRVVVGASFMALPRVKGTSRAEVTPEARSYAIGLRCVYAPTSLLDAEDAGAHADEPPTDLEGAERAGEPEPSERPREDAGHREAEPVPSASAPPPSEPDDEPH